MSNKRITKSRKLMFTGALLAVIMMTTVAPTLSWVSNSTDPVVNTFEGGKITLKLDEALVDSDGKAVVGDEARRVTENTYKYVAGEVLDKDPTVTVLSGSEDCYVFVCAENELNELFTIDYNTFEWLQVAQDGNKTVYAYKTAVETSDEDTVLTPLFTTITVSDELTAEDIESLGEKNISITAFAVQEKSITSQEAVDLAVAQFIDGGTADNYPVIG